MQLVPKQREGVEYLKTHTRAILADEMGSGKTAQVLTAIQELGYTRALVVAPKMVKSVWVREVEKWVPGWKVAVLDGPESKRVETIEAQSAEKNVLLVCNYEQLRVNKNKPSPTLAALRQVDWDAVVFDEAHYLKNRHSLRFRAATLLLSGRYCSVFCLTGTPVINTPGDIWTLLHLCDKNKFPHFWPWVSKHAILLPNPFSRSPIIAGVRSPSVTQEELRDYVLRRSKAEFHELPPRTVTELEITLTAEQRRAYNTMKMHGYYEDTTAGGKLAQVTRLRQICISPQLLTNDTNLSGAKLDAAEEICSGSGLQRVVVFTNYVDAAKEVARRVGGVALTGEVPDSLRQQMLSAFRAGEFFVLCMTLPLGGVGIDLSAASIAVFLDVSWSPAINAQAADRLHRPGQANPVTVYVLTAADTIEERVMKVLQNKDKLFDATVPGVPTETIIKLLRE